jgi:large subunit ribosomal protein L22
MTYHYSLKDYDKEKMARAVGVALGISTKASIMICNQIRKKSVAKAKKILQDAIDIKKAIPYTKFTNGIGHKKGIGSGRYPKKAATNILMLLESAESNAKFLGLSVSDLIIKHISAQTGFTQFRHGNKRRIRAKRTNIEIVLEESKKEAKTEKNKGAEDKK